MALPACATPLLLLLAFVGVAPAAAGGPARVATCGTGPAALQHWKMGVPQSGFLHNTATEQCLNVAGCATEIIYDGCDIEPKQTCGGAGLKGQPNEIFALNGSRILSALPGAKCLTISGTGAVVLAACDPPAGERPTNPLQEWTLLPGGQLKTGDGRCMTAVAGPAPAPAPAPASTSCKVSLVRQLSATPCVRGSTYDCTSDSAMWTAKGCAGLFDCNAVDNIDCDSRHGGHPANTSCACGAPAPPPGPPAPGPGPAPAPPRTNRTNIPM